MPFDLSTARKVKPQGFDLSTAKSADRTIPRSPPETRSRAEVEAELAQREAAANEADRANQVANVVEPWVRGTLQGITGLARGTPLLFLPAAVEDAAEGAYRLWQRANPFSDPEQEQGLPRFFRAPTDLLSPQELAPRDATEEFNTRAAEALGGALGGTAIGQRIAATTQNPVARSVGQTLADLPGRQAIAAGTSAAAGTFAHENDWGPTGELLASTLGAMPAFVGAKPTTFAEGRPIPGSRPGVGPLVDTTNAQNIRPHGPVIELARRMGLPVTPDMVESQNVVYDTGNRAPGRMRSSLAGPEADFKIRGKAANRITSLGLQDIGLAPGGKATPEALESVRGPANAVFDRAVQEVPITPRDGKLEADIKAIGENIRDNPLLDEDPAVMRLRERLSDGGPVETQKVLDAIRIWRRRASRLFNSTDDPAKHEAAAAYRQAADAFETAIERAADAAGRPDLVPGLRGARELLAKVHNIEDSLVGTDIDAAKLAKIGKHVPLSGALRDIATVGEHLGQDVRPVVGVPYPTPSLTQSIINHSYLGRRLGGEQLIPGMLEDGFQNRFGQADPNYAPWNKAPDFPPPPPPEPGPPPPPPDGRYPWSPAGEGPLSLVPDEGGLPFSESQLPALGGDGLALSDQVVPDLFRGADVSAADGLALPGVLDGPDLGPILPRWGAEPFSETQPLQPGASVGLADAMGLEQPVGALNFPPEGAGRGSVVTGGRPVGPRDMGPADLRTVDETLPQRLSDLQQPIQLPGQIGSYGTLEPELQALADVLMGRESPGGAVVPYNALQGLADALGVNLDRPGPTPPMNPPRGSRGLRGQRDALEASRETPPAAPEEFRDLGDGLTLVDEQPATPHAAEPRNPGILRPASEIKLTGRPMNFPNTYRGYHPTEGDMGGPFSSLDEAMARGYDPTGAGTVATEAKQFRNAIGGTDVTMEQMADMLGVEPDGYLIGMRAKELGFDGVVFLERNQPVVVDVARLGDMPFQPGAE